MSALSFIRAWYRPIQPSVDKYTRDIIYKEYNPDPKFSDLVFCYWELKTRLPLAAPFSYRVVSDGCIDIFINNLDPTENFIMGFCKKSTQFDLTTNFHYTGIRFLPSAIPTLFKIDAATLSNKTQWLKNILPEMSLELANISTANSSNFIPVFNQLLLKNWDAARFDYDHRFYDALKCILQNNGTLETESLNTGLSARQLRRIFNYNIGTTPKVFSKVVRFQFILNAKPSMQSLKNNKIFLDAGFYDQAHFIKDFKNFYGIKPSEAFR